MRTTISEVGPLLLSRLLDLNETQAGVLQVAFRFADDEGLLLLDLKDLRALLAHIGERGKELNLEYGRVSTASIGAIQRALLALEEQGCDLLFGEPALNISDLMRTSLDGRGIINVLDASQLLQAPALYTSLLLWLLSELFEELPDVGDLAKPKLVFFFDEAHLLFDDAPPVLLDRIQLVVRLIRSKGVGVYFVTQNPRDIPDEVLGQLGNRVQHALRAFTERDRKAVRAAAETFRDNPTLDVSAAISELSVGEALISFLDARGTPGIVERALIIPPRSRIGMLTDEERAAVISRSPIGTSYNRAVDRESAYEILSERAAKQSEPASEGRKSTSRGRQSMLEAFAKSTLRSIGYQIGRQIVRGIFGTLSRSVRR